MQKFSDGTKKSTDSSPSEEERRNKRKAGMVGGPARAASLSPQRRQEIARLAGIARAAKYAGQHAPRVKATTIHALNTSRKRKIPRTVCGNWMKPGSAMRIAVSPDEVNCKYCLHRINKRKKRNGKVTSTISGPSAVTPQPVLDHLPTG